MVIFQNYGQELAAVQETYENYKNSPPIARNMPPVAGNILWSRHLLRRIEGPMERFHAYPGVLQMKESRMLVKTYNKVRLDYWIPPCLLPGIFPCPTLCSLYGLQRTNLDEKTGLLYLENLGERFRKAHHSSPALSLLLLELSVL